jgi:hypothetical protein
MSRNIVFLKLFFEVPHVPKIFKPQFFSTLAQLRLNDLIVTGCLEEITYRHWTFYCTYHNTDRMQVQKFRHSCCVDVLPDFSHIPPVDNHWPPPCTESYFSFLDVSPFMKMILRAFALPTSLHSYYLSLWVPHIFSLQLLPNLLRSFNILTFSCLIRWHLL